MENLSPGQQVAAGVLYVLGSIAILFVALEWLDLGLRRAVALLIMVMMALGMLRAILWLVQHRIRPKTAIRGFVVAGEYRGVAMFVYAFYFFVQYLFSFYGYGQDLMDGFTFGLAMLTSGIVLAHHAAENWSRSEHRSGD